VGGGRPCRHQFRRRPRRIPAHGAVGARHAREPRDRGGNERDNAREKPARAKSEKRVPLKQKISDAEAEIARITGIIAKIDTALALPDLFKRDPKQAAQLSKARAGAESALQRAEEAWLAASSQYDEATG